MSASLSSVLFTRGADRVYFAALLVCLFYIFCTSGPIPIPFRENVGSPGPLQSQDTVSADDNSTSVAEGFDLADVFKEEQASSKDVSDIFSAEPWVPPQVTDLDESRMEMVEPYITAIMDPKDKYFDRLQCPHPYKNRYKGLRRRRNLSSKFETGPKQYFFALNLYECAHVLPRLLGSVVEAIRLLRPEDCVLSIVGGRSTDGTTEILSRLRDEMEAMNVTYYFSTSDIDPLKQGNDRITELAKLRNLVLDPLIRQPELYDPDATVIFLNDVSICADDIMELVYQKEFQRAHMTCAMDWVDYGDTFYDSWISRSMTGDMFIEIPQDGSFEFKHNLFWNDPVTRKRFDMKLPIQVYSCWNGGAAFTAKPLLKDNVTFRASYKDECYMGEPTLFCKDFWTLGYGRIAIIPSVNVGYNDDESRHVKEKHGYASSTIFETEKVEERSTEIQWKVTPPELVKCEPDWVHPSWVQWDQASKDQEPFDWTHSGYFNADKGEENEGGLIFD
ncbi:uncharacterized protein Z518_09576 [Rhinocladiella mackenziei CBS 650.93]|uniref:Alpha-1,3-mannosyltransferase CMT1 n=1 Tax=Rhinocladiella mackenziei CBS 650.93 TaxID=1442369 RepID=A0A0D2I7M2_9EURO|nr:uncharacterized protein Z518_09576 [Rhinocladiella mackenziei CBS 650.93]KIX01849.1 hypothetical protein Z518_09576 [Rhinocladiella mackenziei CBS 650.93]